MRIRSSFIAVAPIRAFFNVRILSLAAVLAGGCVGQPGTDGTVAAETARLESHPHVTSTGNVVHNGDFEASGQPLDGWTTAGETFAGTPHAGNHSAGLEPITFQDQTFIAQIAQNVSIPSGGRWMLTFWYWSRCTNDGPTRFVASIDLLGIPTEVLSTCNNDQTWRHVVVDVSRFAGSNVNLTFQVTARRDTLVFVDDVSLAPVPSIVFNGDFESNTLDGWQPSEFVTTVTTSHSGQYAALIGQVASGWWSAANDSMRQYFTVPRGSSTLSLWYSANTPCTPGDSIYGELLDQQWNPLQTIFSSCPNNTAWVPVHMDLTPYAGEPVILRFGNRRVQASSTSLLIDDVAITQQGPTPPAILSNGDFEAGRLKRWVVVGNVTISTTTPHSGSFDASLSGARAFEGESTLTQTFDVPNGASTLSFWYNPNLCFPDSSDHFQDGHQQAEIRDASGTITLQSLLNVCQNTGRWTQITANLKPYAGTSISLWFSDHDNVSAFTPSYLLLDDVTIK
jgi:hypothetical protein